MKCPNCGKEIANDSQFCEYCGAKINLVFVDEKHERVNFEPTEKSQSKNRRHLWFAIVLILFLLVSAGIIYYEHNEVEKARIEAQIAREQAKREAELRDEKARQAKVESERKAQEERERARREREELERKKAEAIKEAEIAKKKAMEAERYNRNLPYIRQGYVDLGLSSGTLWQSRDESGFYKFNDAIRSYAGRMPTKRQWEELVNSCSWSYVDVDTGFKVRGPNGNYIIMPVKGCQRYFFYDFGNGTAEGYTQINSSDGEGYYWSSSSSNGKVWRMYFSGGRRLIEEIDIDNDLECSVRLVCRP